jgi:hypothetical protein
VQVVNVVQQAEAVGGGSALAATADAATLAQLCPDAAADCTFVAAVLGLEAREVSNFNCNCNMVAFCMKLIFDCMCHMSKFRTHVWRDNKIDYPTTGQCLTASSRAQGQRRVALSREWQNVSSMPCVLLVLTMHTLNNALVVCAANVAMWCCCCCCAQGGSNFDVLATSPAEATLMKEGVPVMARQASSCSCAIATKVAAFT